MTADEIKEAVLEAINSHPAFDSEMHSAHHQWIEERIEAEKRRKELYMSAAKAFTQWSVLGILGLLAVWWKNHFHY